MLSGGNSPSAAVIRIRPQQIAHGPFMRNLLYSIEGTNIVEGINARGETSVEAEDLVLDQGGEGKEVEEVGEVFPHVCIAVLAEALVVETVDLSDLSRLVVAAEDGDALGVSDLEGHEEGDSFNREVATVDVVACCMSEVALAALYVGLCIPMKR